MLERLSIDRRRVKVICERETSIDKKQRQCMIEELKWYDKNKLYIKNTRFYQLYNVDTRSDFSSSNFRFESLTPISKHEAPHQMS